MCVKAWYPLKKHGISTPWLLFKRREIGVSMKVGQPTFAAKGGYPDGSVGTDF